MDTRARARELAAEYLAKGDPTGWFEELYREAEQGTARVPWADLEPNPNLIEFWNRCPIASTGKRALNIGCGLGDDAELLAAWGFETTAFDISASAIEACKRRFRGTKVRYVPANLLNPPDQWLKSFDFVLESYTLQALPESVRGEALRRIADFVGEGGLLLLITRGREEQDENRAMPWPLTRRELDRLKQAGLEELAFEDYFDSESPPVRRFRVLYRRR
jgi:SAM-dependent methyltransferase